MNRNKALTLLTMTGTVAFAADCQPHVGEKLNIIYIIADDLGYGDLSCYGQQYFETPNIDRLASEGILFTQHYAGCPVSAPSRSVLLSGLHSGHSDIRDNAPAVGAEGQYPIAADTETIAEMLKAQGYATGAFGKWGLGFVGTTGDPNQHGFDEFFGYNCQALAHRYYPAYLWHNDKKVELEGNSWIGTRTYSADLIQEKAMEFIETNKDKPFFLFYPTTLPHAELIVPEDEILEQMRRQIPDDEPYKGLRGVPGEKYGKDLVPRNYCPQPYPHATFAAMITRLDKYVGEIYDKIEELGIAENTILIFTSDNGPHAEGGADPVFFHSNGPLKGIKRDVYEGGIRIPMVARWKNHIRPGTTTDLLSAFWDVKATFADMTGAECGETDGISFLPTLLGKKQKEQHEYLYWEFHGRKGAQAVRFGDWKAVRDNLHKYADPDIELYNLKDDIGETRNVAEQHPDLVLKAKEMMEESHVKSDAFPFKTELSFTYEGDDLLMTGNYVRDHAGEFSADTLRNPEPLCDRKLSVKVNPLTQKMYNIALADCELNIIDNRYGRYFAAGRRYTDRVYTRDIAIAGVLGLDYFYPELVLQSMKVSRDVRKKMGWKAVYGSTIAEIDAPWEEIAETEMDLLKMYKSNSYLRRTDDVIWLWCVDHIYSIRPDLADWEWLYDTAQYFFKHHYFPLYDEEDGLFRGQPVYHDIMSTAYPEDYQNIDCVLLKSSSTNSVYYKGLRIMQKSAEKLGKKEEAEGWKKMAEKLQKSFREKMLDESGEVRYFIDRFGKPFPHEDVLGIAFAIICDVLSPEEAVKAVANYPMTGAGIPLIHPFLDNNGPHNRASWPFASAFYCWAKEKATGEDYTAYNAALMARSLGTKLDLKHSKDWGGFGSFHEKVMWPQGIVCGSGSQLWSAAGFLNVCLRAGMVEGYDGLVY